MRYKERIHPASNTVAAILLTLLIVMGIGCDGNTVVSRNQTTLGTEESVISEQPITDWGNYNIEDITPDDAIHYYWKRTTYNYKADTYEKDLFITELRKSDDTLFFSPSEIIYNSGTLVKELQGLYTPYNQINYDSLSYYYNDLITEFGDTTFIISTRHNFATSTIQQTRKCGIISSVYEKDNQYSISCTLVAVMYNDDFFKSDLYDEFE